MALERLPDFDELATELAQLQHREGDLERHLAAVRDRHAAFPNDVSARQVLELQTRLVELRRQMDDLRVQLLPVMRRLE